MDAVETVDAGELVANHIYFVFLPLIDQTLRTKTAAPAASENTNGETETQSPSDRKSQQQVPAKSPPTDKPAKFQQPQTNGHTDQLGDVNGHSTASEKQPSEQLKPTNSPGIPAKGTAPKPVPGRRNSWISSISSKFSTGNTPPAQGAPKENAGTSPKPSPPVAKQDYNAFGASFSPKDKDERANDPNNPFTSTSPRNPSFLQNAFRKLSSGASGMGKTTQQSAPCQRRVMNVDADRDRCKVPELNQAKLKRVAFCVDVEIAGFSTREEDDTAQSEPGNLPRSHAGKTKGKEKGEAAALKDPDAVVKECEKSETANGDDKPASPPSADGETKTEPAPKEPTRKQEKKKRSEEERKVRKERKRRQAEANGSIPMQLKAGEEEDSSRPSTTGSSRPRAQNHPTTDPVRIYRRCCQLRETPVLKRLVERMTSPSSTLAEAPGTVAVLDLTDFPMTLPDIVTFSDWLAIVPVRKLIMENCALTDEAVRSILAGLLSTKTMQQARISRRAMKQSTTPKIRPFGIVEKLSLKNNPKIGPEGWRHICLFIHLSRSLKAIDLSGVPFPKKLVTANDTIRAQKSPSDIGTTLSASLTTRFGGDRLEELLLSESQPSTEDVAKICDAASFVGLRRLGLASNGLTREGLEHVCRYFQSGKCEGLDLGGNELGGHLDVLIPALNVSNPAMALSFADCALTPSSIFPLLQAFPSMPNFRFVDFSHNPALFANQPDSLSMLRRFLPKMSHLKRIHLADVDLSPDHAIALAEVLPECPSLCHLNILENQRIASLTSTTDPASQEEACAVYASLMAAVRVSRTLIAVDIEVPSAESSEVVKALASQIVAYSLRNLGAIEDIDGSDAAHRPGVQVPEVLQHIVGHNDDGTTVSTISDDPAPDEDYVIGGTGVVKALGVCLGNVDRHHPELGAASRPGSGHSTPVHRLSASISSTTKKPRDMSKNLLGSARNIKARIQIALIREDKAGNDNNYRRLQFLDHTLQKMINRFEEEYPECRIATAETSSLESSEDRHEEIAAATSPPVDIPYSAAVDDEEADLFAIRLSRKGSNTSLHSRALTSEEGRIHRIGQNLRRDFLEPSLNPSEEGLPLSGDESHVHALREKLKGLKGDEIRSRVESVGADKAFQELGSTVEELWIIQQQDQDAFQKFKQSQIAAQINAGLRPPSSQGEKPTPST
ncbi:putative cell wall biogenesis protein Mhp1 [Talaromyces proteolyticus]|uniref:Cell wall biogenesis protein Mhp1 n=1 Tax=Talaromyces proteolyticus TaxID=1131652 RepID=A0AAD4PYY7_9EURO|nr:putative cell wall biogenesis protein Mhp1 [Talaromyces proteolyticus]KAH8698441.1 putative cell wall biogenesis protein Mhp1 [Talaromyces proteolyticus]